MSEWISVNDILPKAEEEVIVLCKSRNYNHTTITTAIYEDGKVAEEDSCWIWVDMDYDEENDRNIIPVGWWEYRHFNGDDAYNNGIDYEVTHWMPLPKVPEVE